MGFDKDYPNRKDRRAPLRGSKAYDSSCRNHGTCPWCQSNRRHSDERRAPVADEPESEGQDV